MATVRDILAAKGSPVVHTVAASATVLEATQYMNEHKIGALVVTQDGRLAGIFSERDVLRRVVAAQLPPAQVPVAEVMTTDLICCQPTLGIDEASRIMKDRRVRHVPVVDPEGELLGIISIGDLNAYHASAQETTIHFLHDYIHGVV